MEKLSAPELATMGNQLFTGQRSLNDLSAPYTVHQLVDGLESCLMLLEERLVGLREEQFQFRIPGSPSGPDWNHDQRHFNTTELVTHLTSSLKGWQEALREQGLPLPPPHSLFPSEAHPTWLADGEPGVGGRDDLTLEQTREELRSTRETLVAALREAPDTHWSSAVESPRFGNMSCGQLVMLMGIHSAAHCFQLLEMQAHDDYPQ